MKDNGDIIYNGNSPVQLKIYDKKDTLYYIGKLELHDAYIQAQIIDNENNLDCKLFKKICDKFFKFVKTKPWQQFVTEGKSVNFYLYVLPSDNPIEYDETRKKKLNKPIIDAFGNKTEYYPTRPTIEAKFMSDDDPAFTLNCKKNEEFYKLLNMGFESFEKVNFYPQDYFFLSGLQWYFQISDESHIENRITNGIYHQLVDIYSTMNNSTLEQKVSVKVICMKISNAKIEILIEENLTMAKLEKMLKIKNDIPSSAFESLLIKKNNSISWSAYLEAVRALLQSRTLERMHLIRIINNIFRAKLSEWITKKEYSKANEFFNKDIFLHKLINQNKEKYHKHGIRREFCISYWRDCG